MNIQTLRYYERRREPINAVAFSPDGQLVATGDGDGADQIWQATSGALQSQFNALRSKSLTIEFARALGLPHPRFAQRALRCWPSA